MTDPVWYGCSLSSKGESWAKYNLAEPIPPQIEHVAVEFIVEPFRQSGPCLRTMKIFAQWCRVDTSYFTLKRETLGGRERLPSRTGPRTCPRKILRISYKDHISSKEVHAKIQDHTKTS